MSALSWLFGVPAAVPVIEETPLPPEVYMVRCVSGWLWQAFKARPFMDGNKREWAYEPIVPASDTCPTREAAEFWIAYDLSGKDPTLHENRSGWPPFTLFHAYYDEGGKLLKEEPLA